MKILWITNMIFPAPSRALGFQEPITGGWMYGLANQIAAINDIQLAVATIYTGKDLKIFEIDNVIYYLLPCVSKTSYSKSLEFFWQKICHDFQPEVIHIHGTEFFPGLACMRACPELNYVVSIQGLVSICARYYFGGINLLDILKNISFRDIVKLDTLFQGKRKFEKRGLFEVEYIKRTQHVIGRTTWDYAHTKSINPFVNYHYCNEILRDSFYASPKWDIIYKTDYTIFLSQAGSPIKGLHQVLKAVFLLKKDFPQIKVRVAGQNISKTNTSLDKIKLSGYGSYIKKLIKQFDLHNQVQFIGLLAEEQMIAEYLNAHLFICPSAIENSPNSLGEAQLLGVPVIASYVGGTPNMITHGETGLLYRFEEVEMLAEYIRNIFVNKSLELSLSKNGISTAECRHHQATNLQQMIRIYRLITE
jgi:glycosyltransferase involved in cell wall biosynthesis